jgi:hypothetical protein
MSWFDEIPKVELHVHLEGAIPHDGLFGLIPKYRGDPSVPDGASDAIPTLIGLLQDADADVRKAATEALEKIENVK